MKGHNVMTGGLVPLLPESEGREAGIAGDLTLVFLLILMVGLCLDC